MNTDNLKNNFNTDKLNRHLFWFITVTLITAVIFLISGFIIDISTDSSYIDIEYTGKNTISLMDYFKAVKNPYGVANIASLSYPGILSLIAIPVLGLLYALGYFIYRKDLKLSLICAGVILIILFSIFIGFMMK